MKHIDNYNNNNNNNNNTLIDQFLRLLLLNFLWMYLTDCLNSESDRKEKEKG